MSSAAGSQDLLAAYQAANGGRSPRIDYLGANTPVEELGRAVDATHPDLIVLAATLPETLKPLRPKLTALARRAPLALAGTGATPQLASAVGARLIAGDPVTEAEQIGWPW